MQRINGARWLVLGSACLACSAGSPSQQPRPSRPDGPKPTGAAIVTWVGDASSANGSGPPLRFIAVRNDSSAPIAITGILLSRCVNLAVACGEVSLNGVVLAPGEVLDIFRAGGAKLWNTFSFEYSLERRPAPECVGATAPTGTLPLATARSMVVPPLGVPAALHGRQVNVQFFVSAAGRVDSILSPGIPSGPYLAKFRTAMFGYRFSSAVDHGCPVPGWAMVTIQF